MGSGKSTLGKKLAALLGRPFIDLDKAIEKKEHTSISSIFENEGESAFREKETACLKEVVATDKISVIALGGGTVCFGTNLQWIKAHGLLVYLELPAAVLADRIANSKQERPLLKHIPGHALLETIQLRLEQRKPFYIQAHLSVNAINLTPQQLQHAILETGKK
jgi:shikimate kinase